MAVASHPESTRLDRLLGYLEQDPANPQLVADAATCAFEAGSLDQCEALLARYQAAHALPPALVHLRGLLAMARGEFGKAVEWFEALGELAGQPAVRYNIAYAQAMSGRHEAAAMLDQAVLGAIPEAATLKLRGLHALGRLDEARQFGLAHAERANADATLVGAVATLMFDRGELDAAQRLAARAPDTADGLVIAGLVALDDNDVPSATKLLQRALQHNPREARATLGLGLCLFAEARFEAAGGMLDDAAARLATHAGAWVAAGWAYLLDGKAGAARERFEHAVELDRGMAEAHGALAVAEFQEDRLQEARHHAQVALRLDPACLSGALAQSLLTGHHGDADGADAIRQAVLNRPLDRHGRSLMQVLISRGHLAGNRQLH